MTESLPGGQSSIHSPELISSVRRTILEHRMFRPGEAVLVAVSGGPDSVALLNILRLLSVEFSLRLGITHLNHELRSNTADRDERFVLALARQMTLPCFIGHRDVREQQRRLKLSLEETARRVRYAFFDDVLKERGFDKVALGHHANDNAEWVLMNFLRGSGPRGLGGIPALRDHIVRPLIRARRAQIMHYLESAKIAFVTDESNHDRRFLRNRIRHELIPELESSYNPSLVAGLNRLAAIMQAEEAWTHTLTDNPYEEAVIDRAPGRITLSSAALCSLPLGAQRRLIRRVAEELLGHLRRIAFGHVDAACKLLRGSRAHARLDWPHGVQVLRREETLMFVRPSVGHQPGTTSAPIFQYRIELPAAASPGKCPLQLPRTLEIEEIGGRLSFDCLSPEGLSERFDTGQQVAFFDMDSLDFPLVLRNVRPGDRFQPLGMQGTQKVKKYFGDHKIPRYQRVRCPVLCCADRIIWLVGHRIDATHRVTGATRTVLKVELCLA